MRTKIFPIVFNAAPILAMVSFIPVIPNDYALTGIFIAVIGIALAWKRSRNDLLIFTFGFFAMLAFEYLFIRTGVETFVRASLGGVMPLWLPFLWGYGFVAIGRVLEILNS